MLEMTRDLAKLLLQRLLAYDLDVSADIQVDHETGTYEVRETRSWRSRDRGLSCSPWWLHMFVAIVLPDWEI